MNDRKLSRLSRILAAGVLAAVLAVPATAQAKEGGAAGASGVWEWVVGLWQEGVVAVWEAVEEAGVVGAEGGEVGGQEQGDQGYGLDPNGG